MTINANRLYELIGNKLRGRREELRLTQAQIAERLGVTRTSITNIESGTQRVPLHVLLEIVDLLEVSLYDVLPDMSEIRTSRTVSVTYESEEYEVPGSVAVFIREKTEE